MFRLSPQYACLLFTEVFARRDKGKQLRRYVLPIALHSLRCGSPYRRECPKCDLCSTSGICLDLCAVPVNVFRFYLHLILVKSSVVLCGRTVDPLRSELCRNKRYRGGRLYLFRVRRSGDQPPNALNMALDHLGRCWDSADECQISWASISCF